MNVALLGSKNDFDKARGLGISRYMFEIHEGLKRLERGGEGVRVSKHEYGPLPLLGRLPLNSYGLYFPVRSLFDNLQAFDIVHNLMAGPFIKPKILRGNAILVTSAHDFIPLMAPEIYATLRNESIGFKAWYEVSIKKGVELQLKSDYLIANSVQTREEAAGLGFDRSRISVVPLGIDGRFLADKAEKGASELFSVGYMGSLSHRKNPMFLLETAKLLSGNSYAFDVYGTTMHLDRLTDYAKGNNIPNVRLRGRAPEERIVEIYDGFDAFLFPSLYEGFGMPIMEAQSRGVPVIIYAHGRIPDETRKYCFQAESPAHAAQIITELKENGHSDGRRKEAQSYARSFTWEKTVAKTFEAYKKLLRN